jgi:superfamily II DNA or RNA helicase
MEIIDFLPKYPNINNYNNDIFNPYLEDLNYVIFNKKEFYDERLPVVEPFPEQPGDLMKHQKIISRFFSSRTLYDQLLLVHEMGSGKSCSAIAAIEQIRSENSTIDGSIIFAKGEALLRNFINELVNKCTSGIYKDPKSSRINNKLVKEYYKFETFETFAKQLKNMSNKNIEDRFSNKILVIDEVHNLRLKKKKEEDLNIYEEFWRLCHFTRNTKILLMSGTPMTDTPEEMANILNLMLPVTQQLPTGKEFLSKYFTSETGTGSTPRLDIRPNMKNDLKNKMKGRVSYLKSMTSKVERIFVGNGKVEGLEDFIVYKDYMSKFQTTAYTLAYEADTKKGGDVEETVEEKSGLYKNSRQASLFVYPDGSYGSSGFNKYISKSLKVSIFEEGKNKSLYNYTLNKELITSLKGTTNEESLIKLEKYSSKYAATIKNILESQTQGKSVFIYSELVKGSGLILFSKILEQIFGFQQANGNETTQSPRYGIISNETTSQAEIINIIRRFNQPDNMNGKIINVIMGSRVISEGISLNNVQSENILTTWWNYTQISQAAARGYRLGSHKDLINSGIIPELKIYQRVSVADNGTPSIDIRMYSISELKDINIKQVERLIKESAFDCALNYKRNYTPGFDEKRECDYMECEYKCDGVPMSAINKNWTDAELDYSTYQLYYNSPHIKDIIRKTIDLFQLNFVIDLPTLFSYFKEYNEFEIICALRTIINNTIVINNKYGIPSYLKEDNNVYFLVDSLSIEANYFSEYYIEYPMIQKNNSYNDIVNKMYLRTIPSSIVEICNEINLNKLNQLLSKFPIEVQQIILENSLIAEKYNIEKNKNLRSVILNYFKNYYYIFDGIIVSDLLYEDNNIIRCLNSDNIWSNCTDEKYIDLIQSQKLTKKKSFEDNEYGYYGQYNKKNNEFCLRDVSEINVDETDKRKLTSGKRCFNYDRSTLTNIVACKLKVPIPPLKGEQLKKYNKLVKDKSKTDLWNIVVENPYTTDCFTGTDEEFNNYTEDDLRRIAYWGTVMRKPMCEFLMEWFRTNDLLDDNDLSCGVATKTKTDKKK